MDDRKTYLRNMVNHTVEENPQGATEEFHKYLSIKMKEVMNKITSSSNSNKAGDPPKD